MTGLFYIEDSLEVKSALKGKTLKLAKKKEKLELKFAI